MSKPAAAKAGVDLAATFDELHSLLKRYSPPFGARTGTVKNKRDYNLWSEKQVIIEGRQCEEVAFAALIEQKGYVGFYLMPLYATPELNSSIPPRLMKLLKGKSCFHVKVLTPELVSDIKSALDEGRALYRKRGWV